MWYQVINKKSKDEVARLWADNKKEARRLVIDNCNKGFYFFNSNCYNLKEIA